MRKHKQETLPFYFFFSLWNRTQFKVRGANELRRHALPTRVYVLIDTLP